MSVFGNYALYYDLLYREKNYEAEADYVAQRLRQHAPGAASLLELGCGTGRHAELLARKGFRVTGVDRSEVMLAEANRRRAAADGALEFHQADIREVALNRRFDAVISLFHVVSYMTENADLQRLFERVRAHLADGGVFLFDCWYGPCVLTEKPAARVLRIHDQQISVTRIAEPTLHASENVVDVNYQILIRNQKTGAVEEIKETHRMRYLFRPEVELMLAAAGMRIVAEEEWMTGNAPGCNTWSVCFICKA